MGYDYSISMEDVRAAESLLNRAAEKVSWMGTGNRPVKGPESSEETPDRVTLSGDMDIAGAMIESNQAKILYQANLKIISMQMKLEDETLNLFG